MKYRTESRALSGRAAGLLGVLLMLLLAIGMEANATQPKSQDKQQQGQDQNQGQNQGQGQSTQVGIVGPEIIINNEIPAETKADSLPDRLDISTTPSLTTGETTYETTHRSLALSSNLPPQVAAPAVGGDECLIHRPAWGPGWAAVKSGHTEFDEVCRCFKAADKFATYGYPERAAAKLDECLGQPAGNYKRPVRQNENERIQRIWEQAQKK